MTTLLQLFYNSYFFFSNSELLVSLSGPELYCVSNFIVSYKNELVFACMCNCII